MTPVPSVRPVRGATTWHSGLVVGLLVGLVLGIVSGLAIGQRRVRFLRGPRAGLGAGFGNGLGAGLAAGIVFMLFSTRTWQASLAFMQLAIRWHTPRAAHAVPGRRPPAQCAAHHRAGIPVPPRPPPRSPRRAGIPVGQPGRIQWYTKARTVPEHPRADPAYLTIEPPAQRLSAAASVEQYIKQTGRDVTAQWPAPAGPSCPNWRICAQSFLNKYQSQ